MTLEQLHESIGAVLDYNWTAEVRDAEENGAEGHIVVDLLNLAEFVGRPDVDVVRTHLGIT
jgi:hypothetical protein